MIKKDLTTAVNGTLVPGFSDLPRWEFHAQKWGEKSFLIGATDNKGNRLEFIGNDHDRLKAWVHEKLLQFETFGYHPGDGFGPEHEDEVKK